MFSRLFIYLMLALTVSVLVAVSLLDSFYTQGIAQDELMATRGINQLVGKDALKDTDPQSRLDYWNTQFNYHFEIKPLDELFFDESAQNKLVEQGVWVDITSGWVVDDIQLFYYYPACNCALVMTKVYRSDTLIQLYIQITLFIILATLACFIFSYVQSHKKHVKKLVNIYQAYGEGQFSTRADTAIPMPYTPLAITFNQMAGQIESLLKEQKTLVHGVSHDLRTPIARLRFALDMCRNCQTLADFQTQIQDMDLDLDELDSLVSEWLYYAELSGQAVAINPSKHNLNELITHVLTKAQVLYPAIEAELVKTSTKDCTINVDAKLFSRALENLIINAFKAANSRIKLSVSCIDETDVCLAVEDDGVGLSSTQLADIIQPFVKLDASRNSQGSGLGLAIVKSILDLHQADLILGKSDLGGARFEIRLKAKKDA
ncbi:two-component sensor histidine kinase [Catenovulum sp. SM1970]|uniref:ATP-binding protein n=1 Tax=Marinifaba aquimaris TaxID=2741323 RepID=UPI0015729B3C|nr:ATP-binding protein [Marinifaba aquimaris]NTS77517.1 two-component sensor histidine kinase [Marinifaba aquimaris]